MTIHPVAVMSDLVSLLHIKFYALRHEKLPKVLLSCLSGYRFVMTAQRGSAETSPTQKGQASKCWREIPNPCIAIPLYKLSCRGMTFLRRP